MLFTLKIKLGLLVISANLSVIKREVCPVQQFCSVTVKKCLYFKHHTIKHLKETITMFTKIQHDTYRCGQIYSIMLTHTF